MTRLTFPFRDLSDYEVRLCLHEALAILEDQDEAGAILAILEDQNDALLREYEQTSAGS